MSYHGDQSKKVLRHTDVHTSFWQTQGHFAAKFAWPGQHWPGWPGLPVPGQCLATHLSYRWGGGRLAKRRCILSENTSEIYSIYSEAFFDFYIFASPSYIFTPLQICKNQKKPHYVVNSDICKQAYKPLNHIVSMSQSIVSCLTWFLLHLVRSACFLLLVTVVKIEANITIYHKK